MLKDDNSLSDDSGNGNNFIVGNGTFTKTEDCPSNVFATFDPLKSTAYMSLSNGNNGFAGTTNTDVGNTYSTLVPKSGKWYAEFKITGTSGKEGNIEQAKLGDLEVKFNTASQGTGSVNNILDVYPWLQSYLGAYMLGGAGSFQMRVVRG